MKNINSLILILGLFLVTGCELDNFDEPKSEFKGRFVYEGEALQLRGTAYDNDCMMYAIRKDLSMKIGEPSICLLTLMENLIL